MSKTKTVEEIIGEGIDKFLENIVLEITQITVDKTPETAEISQVLVIV